MFETRRTPSRNYFGPEMLRLKVLGISLSGDERFVYRVYSGIVLALFNISYPIILASVNLFECNFDVITELFIYVFGTAMGAGMTIAIYLNREKLGKLIQNLELEPFTPNVDRGGKTEEQLLKEWLSFYNKLRIVFYVTINGSLCPPILITLIKRTRSSDYHDWEFGFGPLTVLNVTYSPNYEISWMYQNICMFCIGYSMVSIILLFVGIVSFVGLQLRILQNNFLCIVEIARRNFKKDKTARNKIHNSEIPRLYLQKALKQTIDFHTSILDIGTEIESTFGILVLWMYFTTLILLCFEVFRATQIPLNDPRSYGMLIESLSVIFQTFIICYCGEQVAHQSLEVGRAAYEANFVGTDTGFQKELLIIIRRSQNMMKLKAGKFVEASLTTFVWIMRTSYSAFRMLRNLNMKT